MAAPTLSVKAFGGMLPSVQPRSLPPVNAQLAQNLDLRLGDFRPLRGPGVAVTSVAQATRSLFRTPSGVWLSSTNDVNFVNGQVNTGSERVYLTGRSAYPEAWQDGAYRRLGVPAPTAAPAATLNVTDEFTFEEASDAISGVIDDIARGAVNGATSSLLGIAPSPLSSVAEAGTIDSGADLSKWTLSTPVSGGGNTSVVQAGPAQGNPAPSYVTVRDEGGGPAYAYRDYGAEDSTSSEMLADVIFHHTGVNNSWYSGRDAVLYLQNDEFGSGVRVQIEDSDGMRGQPNAAFLRIRRGTTWDALGELLAEVQLPTKLAQLQVWTVRGRVDWQSNGQAHVTAELYSGFTLISSVQYTGDFDQGGYFGFASFRGPDANGSVDGLPEGFATYFDNLNVKYQSAANFWVQHGTTGSLTEGTLPTSTSRDYAFLVRMSSDTGVTGPFVAGEDYLFDSSIGGRQVRWGAERYWAVPVADLMALGATLNESALRAALAAITHPTTGAALFDAATTDSIVSDVVKIYGGTTGTSRSLRDALNSAQQALYNLLDSYALTPASSSKVSGFKQALAAVAAASNALTDFYAGLLAELKNYITAVYSSTIAALLPDPVTRVVESRAYIVTYVSDWGEESAPSPASALLDLDQNDSITVVASAPPDGRHIVGWRLYRSSATNTTAAWQLVEDKAAAQAVLSNGVFDYFAVSGLSYTDSQTQGELQETCPTLTWDEPPAGLLGLVGLPNGVMAGFLDKMLCLCEPYNPHAWPQAYRIPLEHRIVALGVFGQTLVVLTEGAPYYASGADSASFSAQKIESTQSCAAKRTVSSVEGGVIYASPDGLCLAGPNGITVLTAGAFTREDWQTLNPAGCFGAYAEGIYYLITPVEG